MIARIGQKLLYCDQYVHIYNDKIVTVVDTDNINMLARVGIPDENNMIWDSEWVYWKNLHKPDKKTN